MRNLFDQYDQPENKITHALMVALDQDRALLKGFLKSIKVKPPVKPEELELEEQTIVGQLETPEPEADRKGLPDGWLHDGDEWCLLIESKISSRLTKGQVDRHYQTAARAGYTDITVLSIEVDPKYSLAEIETSADSLQILYGNLKKQVAELTKEKDRLETEIDAKNTEVNSQINQWQQQFSEAQESRSEKFNLWRDQVKKEINDDAQAISNKFEADVINSKTTVLNELEGLRKSSHEKHKSISELYELASGDSIAGGYAQSADKENGAASFWRGASILFILATVGWLLFAFNSFKPESLMLHDSTVQESPRTVVEYGSNPFSWQGYLLSFSITGVLLFGAGYTARQSSKHREEAVKTRLFALQVKALDPYISSLEKTEQLAIRKQLVDRFFTGVDFDEKDSGKLDENSLNVFVSTLQNIVKAMK